MASKKKSTVKNTEVVVDTSVQVAGTGKELQPFAMPQLAKGFLQEYKLPEAEIPVNLNLPDFIAGWETLKPDFPPVFQFTDVGDYLIGTYVEKREKVGPNSSNMYVFEIGQGNAGIRVSVWGKTALDSKMGKIKIGTRCAIALIGFRKAKFGNDFFDFLVKVAH